MFTFDNDRGIEPRYIINFPTRRRRRHKSRIEDIQFGLRDSSGMFAALPSARLPHGRLDADLVD